MGSDVIALWPITVLAAVLGLAFGSFANVVVWRLPRGESLSSPPSSCPRCGARIAWYDNIPVASWLALRGRCRQSTCRQPIPVRYPLIELISGALWVVAWARFGLSPSTPFAIALFYLLLILAAIDLQVRRLPNVLVGILGGLGVTGVVLAWVLGRPIVPLLPLGGLVSHPAVGAAAGVLLGAGLSLGIAVAYERIRKREGFGMGDVKLLAALGVFLGPYVLMTQFLASLLGTIVVVALAAGRDESLGDVKMPFGPSLAAAAVIVTLTGPWVWEWYRGLIV